jgi:hypothetical protein
MRSALVRQLTDKPGTHADQGHADDLVRGFVVAENDAVTHVYAYGWTRYPDRKIENIGLFVIGPGHRFAALQDLHRFHTTLLDRDGRHARFAVTINPST